MVTSSASTGSNTNVVVPMAANYISYKESGFSYPGPLVEGLAFLIVVNGRPLVKLVVDNIDLKSDYTFIVTDADQKNYNLGYTLEAISPGCQIIVSPGETPGKTA
jgi:hypothetical protein